MFFRQRTFADVPTYTGEPTIRHNRINGLRTHTNETIIVLFLLCVVSIAHLNK